MIDSLNSFSPDGHNFFITTTLSGKIVCISESLNNKLGASILGRHIGDILPENVCLGILSASSAKPYSFSAQNIYGHTFSGSVDKSDGEITIDLVPALPQHTPTSTPSLTALGNIGRQLLNDVTTLLTIKDSLRVPGVDPVALATIEKQLMKILRLGKNISDYTAYHQGSFALTLKTHDLTAFFKDFAQRATKTIGDPGIQIILSVPDTPLYCTCDIDKIERGVLNIMSNSIHAATGDLVINLSLLKSKENYITISIRDNGRGCTAEQFSVITQRDGVASPSTNGTGLGLSLAQIFFEMHGGTSLVVSSPGGGTTVNFNLPTNPKSSETNVLSSLMPDYSGGYDHIKLELSTVLSKNSYLDK